MMIVMAFAIPESPIFPNVPDQTIVLALLILFRKTHTLPRVMASAMPVTVRETSIAMKMSM